MRKLLALTAGIAITGLLLTRRKAVPGRLDHFAGKPIRTRIGPAHCWMARHCWGPHAADPECVLRVSEYDDFGEPTGEVRTVRLAMHDGSPLLIEAREINLEGK